MAVHGGPKVVSPDALVLSLDAANLKGYDKYENLLTYSEQFDNAVWTKINSTISSNQIAAPDGTLTADKWIPNNLTGDPRLLQTSTRPDGTYTLSFYAKSAGFSGFRTHVLGRTPTLGSPEIRVYWDLNAGTYSIEIGSTSGSANIQSLNNGWFRCSVTYIKSGTSTDLEIRPMGGTATGDGTSGIYIWGAQLEIGSSLTDYYPTTTTTKTRGTTWTDLSGRGNNGTLINSPTYLSTNGGSIVFDGVDDYVRISNATNLNNLGSQDFTVSTWIYRATNPPGGNGEMLYQSATLDNGFLIGISDTGFRIELRDNQSTNSTLGGVSNIFTAGIWNNVVLTKQGTTCTGYSQGISRGSFTSYQDLGTNSGFVDIGRVDWWGPGNWEGRISQVQVYNRALTAAEIQQNFNASKSRYGL